MKVFHDSRNVAYRMPYGVLPLGDTVTLFVDVWDAPGATVAVRTWVDGQGEAFVDMEEVAPDSHEEAEREGAPVRYKASLTPGEQGIVWYHFVITEANGAMRRYGAREGRSGGPGQLLDWEPPSFRLTVVPAISQTVATQDAPAKAFCDYVVQCEDTVWELDRVLNRSIVGAVIEALASPNAREEVSEIVETLRENCAEETLARAMSLLADRDVTHLVSQGALSWFSANDDVAGFWHRESASSRACIVANASRQNAYDVVLPVREQAVCDAIGGYKVRIVALDEVDGSLVEVSDALPEPPTRYALVHLDPLGIAVLYFHDETRMAKPLAPGAGVLAHITSLPASGPKRSKKKASPGTLGPSAYGFVDWLAQAGMTYWQVLPANPTDEHGSPYAGISAFAGNVRLLDAAASRGVDFDDPETRAAYDDFCQQESHWLEPYACFMAIREKMGEGVVWQDWPDPYRSFDPAVVEADKALRASAEQYRRQQFDFERQWHDVRAYANAHGIQVIGDMPLYVSADSADVWAHPELFQLDEAGNPSLVAGCPPDAFAEEGQVWGNPIYDWDAAKRDDYEWWMRRLERAFDLYDVVRLDHFIGFARYFSIPAGKKAAAGFYRPGPGFAFFKKAFDRFGPLPIIAEDLGSITPGVRSLIAACGFLGMDIIQFAEGGDPLSGYGPRPDKIAYTGTHDNQTLVGYAKSRYPDEDAHAVAEALVHEVVSCDAPIAIIPLQDLFGLDDSARMNVPGVAEGNWTWQATSKELQSALDAASEVAACRSKES